MNTSKVFIVTVVFMKSWHEKGFTKVTTVASGKKCAGDIVKREMEANGMKSVKIMNVVG
jgi:hypothetical protein